MLHPDSHNMFENGSFLRRRRRFKQESAHHTHRHQHNVRQRAQRNAPNSTSPNDTVDGRINGTKISRSRHQIEKDVSTDDSNGLESPRKVG
jgi:hypothetical protein